MSTGSAGYVAPKQFIKCIYVLLSKLLFSGVIGAARRGAWSKIEAHATINNLPTPPSPAAAQTSYSWCKSNCCCYKMHLNFSDWAPLALAEDIRQTWPYAQRAELSALSIVLSAVYLKGIVHRYVPSVSALLLVTPVAMLSFWLPLLFSTEQDEMITRILLVFLRE